MFTYEITFLFIFTQVRNYKVKNTADCIKIQVNETTLHAN